MSYLVLCLFKKVIPFVVGAHSGNFQTVRSAGRFFHSIENVKCIFGPETVTYSVLVEEDGVKRSDGLNPEQTQLNELTHLE